MPSSAQRHVEHGGAAPRSHAQPARRRHHDRQDARSTCAASSSEVVDELRRAYPGREIAWTGGTGLHAHADRDRLAQVFSNLVGNALEHGDPARPVTVGRPDDRRRRDARSFTTTAPPISPELLADLFEPFRGTVVRSERSRGLGLGLYITEQIIRAHGGRVEVASTPERRHDLQRRPTARRRAELVESVQQQAGIVEAMATRKSVILVVEDEKESRDTLRELLEFEGYSVKTAVNGQRGPRRR